MQQQTPDIKQFEISSNSQNMGGAFLSLSLFIILLAFFIILTAASNFDQDKTTDVIDSLEQSFASKVSGDNDYPAQASGPIKSTGQGAVLDKIEGVFNARFLNSKMKRSYGKNTAYMRIDKEQLLTLLGLIETDVIGTAERDVFFHKLQVVLTSIEGEKPYQIHLTSYANTSLDTKEARLAAKQAEIRQLDALAQAIVEAGFPKDRISIGLERKKTDQFTLYFRAYTPIYPEAGEGGTNRGTTAVGGAS